MEVSMRKLILYWLFGTSDIEDYIILLARSIHHGNECIKLIEDHKQTLRKEKEVAEIALKLLKICDNHGIDADEEIKHIEL
jgi:hypothetical protein